MSVTSTVRPFPMPTIPIEEYVYLGVGMAVLIIGWYIVLWILAKKFKRTEQVFTLTTFWLVLSAFVHMYIEGAFVFFRNTSNFKNALDLYAAADYRYGDYGNQLESGTQAMEVITAVLDGPLCLLVTLAMVTNSGWRHPLQMLVSTMQMYGLIWFILQPNYSDTGVAGHFSSDPFLFYVIMVATNAPWGIVPPILFTQSILALKRASDLVIKTNKLAEDSHKKK